MNDIHDNIMRRASALAVCVIPGALELEMQGVDLSFGRVASSLAIASGTGVGVGSLILETGICDLSGEPLRFLICFRSFDYAESWACHV